VISVCGYQRLLNHRRSFESRIDIEIKQADITGFAEFGVLLIERWNSGAEIIEPLKTSPSKVILRENY
jgi:hypothetical protein